MSNTLQLETTLQNRPMERAVHGHLASVWTIPITPDSNVHFFIRLFRQSDFYYTKFLSGGIPGDI